MELRKYKTQIIIIALGLLFMVLFIEFNSNNLVENMRGLTIILLLYASLHTWYMFNAEKTGWLEARFGSYERGTKGYRVGFIIYSVSIILIILLISILFLKALF